MAPSVRVAAGFEKMDRGEDQRGPEERGDGTQRAQEKAEDGAAEKRFLQGGDHEGANRDHRQIAPGWTRFQPVELEKKVCAGHGGDHRRGDGEAVEQVRAPAEIGQQPQVRAPADLQRADRRPEQQEGGDEHGAIEDPLEGRLREEPSGPCTITPSPSGSKRR